MERTEAPDLLAADLILDLGNALARQRSSDCLSEDLMRVADDPLLLKAIIARHGREAGDILSKRQFHVRVETLDFGVRTGRLKVGTLPYGADDPLKSESLYPEEFEPSAEDESQSLWVSKDGMGGAPIFRHGGLIVASAGVFTLALVLLMGSM